MESHVKIAGHPIHPMLIVLPLGMLAAAVIFDIVYLITGSAIFPTITFYDMAAGIIGGLLAAIFGFVDWLALPAHTRAKTVGLTHGLGNVLLVALFVVSWLMRFNAVNYVPSSLALVFSFAGILLGLVTAWLGGEMVFRLRVAVDRGANLDAPSSLGRAPASSVNAGAAVVGRGSGDFREDTPTHEDDVPPPSHHM
ncbi:MAG TPA: DUF2231 domain-containing protein [Anaerolineaceae bacterium]|jgi:uncharacterized membrane protein